MRRGLRCRRCRDYFSNFGSLKSTETVAFVQIACGERDNFSNFGSLKSTETRAGAGGTGERRRHFSNFGSLKSTETFVGVLALAIGVKFQQFRLVEEH